MNEIQVMREERQTKELLLNQEIFQKDFKVNFHKNVINAVILTFFVGGFFAWCSAGIESNIYLYLKRWDLNINESNSLFLILPIPISTFLLFALPVSIKNRVKKLNVEKLLFPTEQSKIFIKFISSKLSDSDNKQLKNMKDLLEYISNKEVEDITFKEEEFEDYIRSYISELKIDMSMLFEKRYSKLILLNQCIDETLVRTKTRPETEYTFIVKDNHLMLWISEF